MQTVMTDETKAHQRNINANAETGVQCLLDGVWVHSIPAYLSVAHPDVSLSEYESAHPGTPLYSKTLQDARAKKAAATMDMGAVYKMPDKITDSVRKPLVNKKSFAEVFELGSAKAAINPRGEPIMIEVLSEVGPELADYVPDIDRNYVFNIDLLKKVMMGFVLNMPVYSHGKHGTGKTTLFEQYCARTGRPAIRVQHTISTEESHVLGQYVVRDGSTHFEPGPLAIAMRYGMAYIADEYDFALPSVTSVYQPVLEGKRLIIKEASPEWRVVQPHPNFRFLATGNTNGAGDETGLYQGTQIQNAANFSRFGITIEVGYMEKAHEVAVVAAQGGVPEVDARRLVDFAEHVRLSYAKGDISLPISPRELIGAAKLARVTGGQFRQGLSLAFMNRLNSTDKKAVEDVAQRLFTE